MEHPIFAFSIKDRKETDCQNEYGAGGVTQKTWWDQEVTPGHGML